MKSRLVVTSWNQACRSSACANGAIKARRDGSAVGSDGPACRSGSAKSKYAVQRRCPTPTFGYVCYAQCRLVSCLSLNRLRASHEGRVGTPYHQRAGIWSRPAAIGDAYRVVRERAHGRLVMKGSTPTRMVCRLVGVSGAPGEIRTPDPLVRRQLRVERNLCHSITCGACLARIQSAQGTNVSHPACIGLNQDTSAARNA